MARALLTIEHHAPSRAVTFAAPPLASIRAQGRITIGFAAGPKGTRLADLAESGGYRAKFPDVGHAEAVIVNTAGGMAGGDHARFDITVGAGASAVLTTVAAEKIYRAEDAPTRIDTTLALEPGAALRWLPQETILFDRARLARRFEVDMAADATLIMAECLVFGRAAMGETIRAGGLEDRWRVRREGRLVFAENLSLGGPVADLLARPAIGGGARAVASLLVVSPEASALLERLREGLDPARCECGASTWNGLLVARFVGPDAAPVRADLALALSLVAGHDVPRVWRC